MACPPEQLHARFNGFTRSKKRKQNKYNRNVEIDIQNFNEKDQRSEDNSIHPVVGISSKNNTSNVEESAERDIPNIDLPQPELHSSINQLEINPSPPCLNNLDGQMIQNQQNSNEIRDMSIESERNDQRASICSDTSSNIIVSSHSNENSNYQMNTMELRPNITSDTVELIASFINIPEMNIIHLGVVRIGRYTPSTIYFQLDYEYIPFLKQLITNQFASYHSTLSISIGENWKKCQESYRRLTEIVIVSKNFDSPSFRNMDNYASAHSFLLDNYCKDCYKCFNQLMLALNDYISPIISSRIELDLRKKQRDLTYSGDFI
ncbi:hypothetical protein SNEBB_002023 [Seison nebaliae]|nr:hypothetical protein SNEBB_002023 [Seison nebaliae]